VLAVLLQIHQVLCIFAKQIVGGASSYFLVDKSLDVISDTLLIANVHTFITALYNY
jgi:hypothetical protein